MKKKRKLLGDILDEQFKSMGVARAVNTIEKLLNQSCGCGNRKEKLNALHRRLIELGEDVPAHLKARFNRYK